MDGDPKRSDVMLDEEVGNLDTSKLVASRREVRKCRRRKIQAPAAKRHKKPRVKRFCVQLGGSRQRWDRRGWQGWVEKQGRELLDHGWMEATGKKMSNSSLQPKA